MKTMEGMIRIVNGAVLCVLLASAAVAEQAAQPTTDRMTVPFSDPERSGTLRVNLLDGTVTIKGSNRRDVLFVANSQQAREALRRRQQAEPPPGMRRLSQPGGFGVEERDNEMSLSSGFGREINLEVEVPMRTKLRVSIVDGGITVDGVDSEMEINTVDGGITLTNVGGSVVAHAVDGNIAATVARVAPQAPMAFTSLNGDIDVTLPAAVKANLRLRSDQGDVFTDFDVQVTAGASANRTQDRNGRRVRIDVNRSIYGTVNGGGPDFELRTFDGNIYVRKGK
jgi:opacity protein-like surface antigen